MSNQLKLFLYIVFVVAIFLFVQTKFHIFNVTIGDGTTKQQEDPSTTNSASDAKPDNSNYVEIVTGANKSVKVDVEIADNDTERKTGLSFRKYLGDYDGMLFVFDHEVSTPFWMKDMLIPLDMIFFDDQGFIIDIKDSQAPCTSTICPSLYSKEPYKYVLEVNSGFCENNGIVIGGSLVLHLNSIN